jgi:hypothetical protein
MAGRDRTRRARPRRRCFEDRAAYRPFPRLYCVAALACRDWQGSADAFVQVRSRLFAGGNRIRTIGPSRENASVLFGGMAMPQRRKGQSRNGGRHSRGPMVRIRLPPAASQQQTRAQGTYHRRQTIDATRSRSCYTSCHNDTAKYRSGYPSVLAQPGSWRTAKISKLGCR